MVSEVSSTVHASTDTGAMLKQNITGLGAYEEREGGGRERREGEEEGREKEEERRGGEGERDRKRWGGWGRVERERLGPVFPFKDTFPVDLLCEPVSDIPLSNHNGGVCQYLEAEKEFLRW
jgi:hypothetical protein